MTIHSFDPDEMLAEENRQEPGHRPTSIAKTTFDVDSILDGETRHELEHLGEDRTTNTFRIGDLANQTIAAHIAENTPVTAKQVYKAVAKVVQSTSERTVRYWAEVAAAFPPKVRKKYPMLSFSHYAAARKRVIADHHWQLDFLEFASERVPRDASALVGEFLREKNGHPPNAAPHFQDIFKDWYHQRDHLIDWIAAHIPHFHDNQHQNKIQHHLDEIGKLVSRQYARTIGETVKAAREARGLTPEEQADQWDIPLAEYHRIERGEFVPASEYVYQLSEMMAQYEEN